jgi:hypothetical protein
MLCSPLPHHAAYTKLIGFICCNRLKKMRRRIHWPAVVLLFLLVLVLGTSSGGSPPENAEDDDGKLRKGEIQNIREEVSVHSASAAVAIFPDATAGTVMPIVATEGSISQSSASTSPSIVDVAANAEPSTIFEPEDDWKEILPGQHIPPVSYSRVGKCSHRLLCNDHAYNSQMTECVPPPVWTEDQPRWQRESASKDLTTLPPSLSLLSHHSYSAGPRYSRRL